MKKYLLIYVLMICLLLIPFSLSAQTFTVYTEEFPPFSYTEAGKITGISTEIVEAVMKQTGMEFVIKSYPWARAYKVVQEEPNTFIYSISRQPNREDLFQWIGILVPSVQSVFTLQDRSDITIETFDDLKRYKIGTTIGDARETYLMEQGFDLSTFQRLGGKDSYLRNFQLLRLRRIDVWPMPDAVAFYIARKAGEDPEKVLRKVFELSEISQGGYYLATNLSTSDDVVKKINSHLEEFKRTAEYNSILKKWGVMSP